MGRSLSPRWGGHSARQSVFQQASRLAQWVAVGGLLLGVSAAAAPDNVGCLQVRLSTLLTSHSRPGTPIELHVIGSARPGRAPVLPVGSVIRGRVAEAKPVGIGLRRDRASVRLVFDECRTPDAAAIPCQASLVELDNMRESLAPENKIVGIRAAAHTHSWLGGVWLWPDSGLAPRSVVGLTGVTRIAHTQWMPHPLAAVMLIQARLIFTRMPQPEIQLTPGAEMTVHVSAPAAMIPADDRRRNEIALPERLAAWLIRQPVITSQPEQGVAADIINVALAGSRDEIIEAFTASGWAAADPITPRTRARLYAAYAGMRPYLTAPVSPLLYQDRLPELVFQKSHNTVSRRHHIRLWQATSPAGEIWLGAATHDVGLSMRWSRLNLTHRINPHIDRERNKVLNDLEYTGCIESVSNLSRPELARGLADGARIVTDGALAVVTVKRCGAPPEPVALAPHRLNLLARGVRRVLLESRHYLLRGNAYYLLYRGLRYRRSNPIHDPSEVD